MVYEKFGAKVLIEKEGVMSKSRIMKDKVMDTQGSAHDVAS